MKPKQCWGIFSGNVLINGTVAHSRRATIDGFEASPDVWKQLETRGYSCRRVLVIDPHDIEEILGLFGSNDGWDTAIKKLCGLIGRPGIPFKGKMRVVDAAVVAARPMSDFAVTPRRPKKARRG
jgi:hypothetical protein